MSCDLFTSKPATFIYRVGAIDQLDAAKSFYGVQAWKRFLRLEESSMAAGLTFVCLVEGLDQ